MSRIRTIKPDITLDYELAQLGFAARYFFINLWCHCDRKGRVEDDPRKLQAQILPWDQEISADTLLNELAPKFLVRYKAANGKRYIQVRHFVDHQRPNQREADSSIPAPTEKDMSSRASMCKHVHARGEGKGREGKGTEKGKGMDIAPSALPAAKELTPIQRVVNAYKLARGVDKDDKGWDRANFGRYSKAAKSILECFGGSTEKAVAYVVIEANRWIEKGLEFTLETIARHAWDNKGKLTENEHADGHEAGAVDANHTLGSRGPARATPAGEIAGEVLQKLGLDSRSPLPVRDADEIQDAPFLDEEHG